MLTRFVCLFALSTLAVQGGVVGGVVNGVPQVPPPVQVGQPRDPAGQKPRVGTGTIAGRVTDAETGAPLRRALVNLTGGIRRSTYTDFEGRYQFTNLPSGTYRIFVTAGPHRAGYHPLMYGSSSSAFGSVAPGKPIELDNEQRLENIDVALPRAGVIAGRVTDAHGEPASRVHVSAFLLLPGTEPRQVGGASTDDLGHYRLFGLAWGDYIVMANPSIGAGGTPVEIDGEPTGFAPTYAPGTHSRAEAMRVRVGRGTEAAADIRLTETRVYSISGTATNSKGEPSRGLNVMLTHPEAVGGSSFGTSVQPGGNFTIRNVPPGQYELVARWSPPPGPGTMIGPDPNQEYVSVPVDVSTSDLGGIVLVTQPVPVITGEIVFDEPPPQFHQPIIGAQAINRSPAGPPRVQVKGNQFTITGAFMPIVLRASFPAGPTWGLKAVLLRGRDITEVPTIFTAQDSGHLQVHFTARAASLEGTVIGDDGRPAEQAAVVVFGQDPSSWTSRSPFYRNLRVVKDGSFKTSGLRDGTYYVAALPVELAVSLAQPTTEFLESLSKAATAVTVTPGEQRRVDVPLLRMQ